MKAIIPIIGALALLVPAGSVAVTQVGPSAGGPHTTSTVTAQAPDGRTSAPSGFGGPATTYTATVTAPKAGCGAPRHVSARETGQAIDSGGALHFTLHAPHRGWCTGRYRVVVRRTIAIAGSADATDAGTASTDVTVLTHTSFRVR
jgi:hypothetical protein